MGMLKRMPRRPSATRRWLTAATWPSGIALTAWDYMWRSTPMRRSERLEGPESWQPWPPVETGSLSAEIQGVDKGYGPLFHRRYRTRISETAVRPQELMHVLQANVNRAAPTTFARFQKVHGEKRTMCVGDEYVVRMPGPWDGPVRVIDVQPCSFRLATLDGHLEAGQIEFRVASAERGQLAFEIESWARSNGRVSNLLYHRVRFAKEVQAHMWISFLEGVVSLSGGRMTGGIEIKTRRVEELPNAAESLLGPPTVRQRLAGLSQRRLNFDPAALRHARPEDGWIVTDLCQTLPPEAPGKPERGGSWDVARALMQGYEFADPSIVRAYYDPAAPLEGRNMLLELQALRLFRLFVGVRVGDVHDQVRHTQSGDVQVWGWNYRTLEGHVEMGQMDWEVWKWLESGAVEFHVHAVSRPAPIANPVVRLGFRVLRERERGAFLESTKRRMRTFTELALQDPARGGPLRSAAVELTARRSRPGDRAHDELTRWVG